MSGRTPGLHADVFGQGPDLVMVHGWAMHGGVMRDFAELLAEDYRITLIDLPGHGRSGCLPEFSPDRVAEALCRVVPPEAHWLGWSLGALCVLAVAARAERRVRSLTLMAGSPRFTAAPGWPGVDPALLGQVGRDLVDRYGPTLRRFVGLQTFGMDNARELSRRIEARLDECEAPATQALLGGLDVLQQADLRGVLSGLSCPGLALLGARDRLVPVAVAPFLQELTPRLCVEVLDMAAHLPFLTHPQETAALVRAFLCRAGSE